MNLHNASAQEKSLKCSFKDIVICLFEIYQLNFDLKFLTVFFFFMWMSQLPIISYPIQFLMYFKEQL